jgi:hypothetical protein
VGFNAAGVQYADSHFILSYLCPEEAVYKKGNRVYSSGESIAASVSYLSGEILSYF